MAMDDCKREDGYASTPVSQHVRNEERVKAEGLYRKHHNLSQDDRFQRDVDGKSQSKPQPTAVTTGADSHPDPPTGITLDAMKDSAFMEESLGEVPDSIVCAVLEGEAAALSAVRISDGGTGNLLGSCYDLDMPCCSSSPQIHLGKGVQPFDASTGMDFLTGDGGKEDDDDEEVEGFEEQIVLSAKSGLGAHGEEDGKEEEELLHSHWRVSVEGFMSEEKSIAAFEEAVIAQRLFMPIEDFYRLMRRVIIRHNGLTPAETETEGEGEGERKFEMQRGAEDDLLKGNLVIGFIKEKKRRRKGKKEKSFKITATLCLSVVCL
eukprot:gene26605-35277_t